MGCTGRPVYHGPPALARPYLGGVLRYSFPPNENVADTILDIVMGERCLGRGC